MSAMANGLVARVGLCAVFFAYAGCGSNDAPQDNAAAGASVGGAGGTPQGGGAGRAAGNATPGSAGHVPIGSASGGTASSSGTAASAAGDETPAGAGAPEPGPSGGPPAAVDGHSVYALECHGDSKDCNLAAVPCFGVGSQTPDVAAGWACANRCKTNADCSNAPSGAEAEASCVAFSSASHCVLVCKNETKSFACPDGMSCYVPAKSPVGYCLWQ